MRNGLVSETCIASGAFLFSRGNDKLGISLLVLGLLGGCLSFLIRASLSYAREKRSSESFEIIKTILLKLIQVANDIGVISQKDSRTVH